MAVDSSVLPPVGCCSVMGMQVTGYPELLEDSTALLAIMGNSAYPMDKKTWTNQGPRLPIVKTDMPARGAWESLSE